MRLRFTPRATANLIEIADYIHSHNPAAAQRVRAAIYDRMRDPHHHPYSLILIPGYGDALSIELSLTATAAACTGDVADTPNRGALGKASP